MNLRRAILWAAGAAAIGFSVSSCGTPPSRAWCFNSGETGTIDCAYDTFRQCMATQSGVGGTCQQNGWTRPKGDRRSRSKPQ